MNSIGYRFVHVNTLYLVKWHFFQIGFETPLFLGDCE